MIRARILVPAVLLTGVAYAMTLGVTSFLACGLSGCSGGGFGPSFAPHETQVGLVVCGLALLPLAWLVLHRLRRARRTAACAAVVLAGACVAMLLLELGPNGCPWGRSQVLAGPGAFDPGRATCAPYEIRR